MIVGVVIDGKRGVRAVFKGIPVQMCHFHQVAIISRKLTSKPKLAASVELQGISRLLRNAHKEAFIGLLEEWHNRWVRFH